MAAISLYCLFLEFSLLSISSGASNDFFLYDNCSKEQISTSKARLIEDIRCFSTTYLRFYEIVFPQFYFSDITIILD